MTLEPKKLDLTFTSLPESKIQLLKNTICKGANDTEFQIFLHACQRTGLDPFMKQIHAVKRPERLKDGTWRESMTIQTAIDGYRLIAERTNKYSPGKEPTYQYDTEGRLLCATAYIKKQTADGSWHEVSASAFYEEYVQTTKDGKPTKFWEKMKHNQLAKCAESLALRRAFPAELSGIYTTDEMGQASFDIPTEIEVAPKDNELDEKILELMNFVPESDKEIGQYYIDYCKNYFKEKKGSRWIEALDKTLTESLKDKENFLKSMYAWNVKQITKSA